MTKTIKVNEETHKRLQEAGSKGETFQDVINKILDKAERTDDLEYDLELLKDLEQAEEDAKNGKLIECTLEELEKEIKE